MKSFVYNAFLVFLGTVAVQCYGPNIHGGPHNPFHHGPPHWFHHGPPHGFHHGPPHGFHHGPPHGPPHGFHHGPPHGPHHPPHDWFPHPHLEDPCKPPHNQEPPKTTPQPVPATAKPILTTPIPIPATPKPMLTTPQPVPEIPKPILTTPQPVPEIPKPILTTPQPVPATPKPILTTPQPVPEIPKPILTTPQPVPATPKPILTTPQPVPEIPKPILTTPQPVPATPKPILTTPQPVPAIPKPVLTTPQPVPATPKPILTTPRPVPATPKSIMTTPQPVPATPKPILTTPKPMPTTSLPPHPAYTQLTPKPTGITAGGITNPTTPQIVPLPTSTIGPIARPPITMASTPTVHSTTPTEDTTYWKNTTNSVPETSSFIPVKTTSNPAVETTTAEGEESPTISQKKIEECINLCLSTPEYNPVCGSDGVTYNNEGKLFCAGSCGVNVTLVRRSACPPPNQDSDDNDGGVTPPPTTTTTPPFHGHTTSLSEFQRCMKLCPITTPITHVCGTDLETYMNIDRLKCAQSCGKVVEVLCEKPCAACGYNPVTPKTTTLRPSTTPQTGITPQEPDELECINACPVTPEYNPVCGSNHVTYSNPSNFVCAQLCGFGVAVVRFGPCSPTPTSSTTTVHYTTAPPPTLSPNVLRCIQRCPVKKKYDPVCGSDNVTYNNLGSLLCSKFCGVEVDFKHKSRCVDEFGLGPDGTDSTQSQTTPVINGNKDHVTTPSQSPTTTTATPSMTPTPTPTSTTNAGPNSSSPFGFKIPQDVLDVIFGSTTTQVPTSKPKNPDDDEVPDIDPRLNLGRKQLQSKTHSKIIFRD